MNKTRAIAIDGPSGAGKSTIARSAAKRFNYIYVDTGAIYRTVGLCAIRNNIDYTDPEKVAPFLSSVQVEMKYDEEGRQRMILNGSDVTDDIRFPEVSQAASKISAILCVRDFLLQMQRSMAERYNVIMDGRDIGTVVLPNADVKIFLTASQEERAERRFKELLQKGLNVTYDKVYEDMKLRDYQDSNRDAAPLKAAQDAIIIDTTGNSLEESIDLICKVIKDRLETLSEKDFIS